MKVAESVWGRVGAVAALVGGVLSVVFGVLMAVVEYAGWHHPTLLLMAENSCPTAIPECAGQPSVGTSVLVQLITMEQADWYETAYLWLVLALVPLLTLVVALVLWPRLRVRASRLALWGGVLALVGTLAEMFSVLLLPRLVTPQTPRVLDLFRLGAPVCALGVVLLGIAAWRVRPLSVGNRLLVPLGVLLVVPFVLTDVWFTLVPIVGTAGVAAYQQNLNSALGLWTLIIPSVAQAVGGALLIVIGVGLWRSAPRGEGVRAEVPLRQSFDVQGH